MTSTICVDASLVLRLVVADPLSEAACRLWRDWADEGRQVVAPVLLHYEATNVLHRLAGSGALRPETAREALEVVLALPVRLLESPQLAVRAWELARQLGLPAAYDAHYLAVAEQQECELWTADGRLARAVAGAETPAARSGFWVLRPPA